MSRIIPIDLQAQYDAASSTLCRCLHLTRTDGVEVFATTLDRPITVDGDVYEPGAEVVNIVSTIGLAVDNTELRVLPDDTTDPEMRDDVLSGRWNNAAFRIFELNYRDPDARVTIMRGTFGQLTTLDGEFKIELRSLKQYLQQPVGSHLSPTCRANFADYPQAVVGNLCRLDVADWTVTSTITSVSGTPKRIFTDSSRSEPDDAFGSGLIKFLTGPNAGLTYKVRDYTDAGVFTLATQTYLPVQVGDTYEAIWGCRKRHERSLANPTGVSDCIDKFDNILNFQGEPFALGPDTLTGAPDRTGA